MKGIFKVLYVAGILSLLSSITFLPLAFNFNADYDFRPEISNPQFLVGKWIDKSNQLELYSDSTYFLTHDNRFLIWGDSKHCEGTWEFDDGNIYLYNLNHNWPSPWAVNTSDGYYFITYSIPDNFDAWTGNLDLMREQEWLDSH